MLCFVVIVVLIVLVGWCRCWCTQSVSIIFGSKLYTTHRARNQCTCTWAWKSQNFAKIFRVRSGFLIYSETIWVHPGIFVDQLLHMLMHLHKHNHTQSRSRCSSKFSLTLPLFLFWLPLQKFTYIKLLFTSSCFTLFFFFWNCFRVI